MYEWIICITLIIIDIVVMLIGGWLFKFVMGCFSFAVGAYCITKVSDMPLDYWLPLILIIIGILTIISILSDRT